MLLIPFRDGRVLMHMLNDVAPADAGIVGAETNLAFLSSIRNYAHLRTTEVVIEKILEPHPSDEKKIPTISPSSFYIILFPIAADLAVVLTCQTKRFVELLKQFI